MRKGDGDALRKHLSAMAINTWSDITRSSLYDLRDYLAVTLAPGSQKTLMGNFKAVLNRVKDEVKLPEDYAKILSCKVTKPMKTYLTKEDLDKLQNAPTHTARQEYVKNIFMICAYTGLRVGDAMNLTPENIVGDNLHYVAQKTKKPGAIPLKRGLAERIAWVAEHQKDRVTIMSYNRAIRKMCKDAGIDDEVVVTKGGKEMRGPKWQFITSHTARVSTASNLNKRGVPLGDITALLQHSGTAMTERYIVRDRVELSPEAMAYFE